MKRFLTCLTVAALLTLPLPASACPLCKEAIDSPGEGETVEEINHLPLAFNRSIYLMVSVPYLLLGGVGVLIYRGCKRNAEVLGDIET